MCAMAIAQYDGYTELDVIRTGEIAAIQGRNAILGGRPVRMKPMPKIDSSPTIRGPLSVSKKAKTVWDKTNELKREYEIKIKKMDEDNAKKEKKKSEKNQERDLIYLLAKQERYERKIEKLDPVKKKDSKNLASLNVKLRKAKKEIQEIQEETGITIDNIETGSRLSKFWRRVKDKGRKIKKAIKRFYEENHKIIEKVVAVILPFIGTWLIKKFLL